MGFVYSKGTINLLAFIHALNVEHFYAFRYALLVSYGTLRNDADAVISIRLTQFILCPDIGYLGSIGIILMWWSPVQGIPYESTSAADVH
jgi:hypothetical protein